MSSNTTSASVIISTVIGIVAAEATGRCTRIDDKGVERKADFIEKALFGQAGVSSRE